MGKKLGYKLMPPAVHTRTGCKVSWYYYTGKAIAEQASKIARHNAEIDASQGYDFGYQCPGSIRQVKGGEFDGLYEVCVS